TRTRIRANHVSRAVRPPAPPIGLLQGRCSHVGVRSFYLDEPEGSGRPAASPHQSPHAAMGGPWRPDHPVRRRAIPGRREEAKLMRTAAWYGDLPLDLDFPETWDLTMLRPPTLRPLAEAAIAQAI